MSDKVHLTASEIYKRSITDFKAQLIRKHCKKDEFVVDVDGDDEFIGYYALGLINTVLQENPQKWFLVANSIIHN